MSFFENLNKAHLKRKFVDVIKTDPKNAVGTVAFDGNEQIAKIYHEDNKKRMLQKKNVWHTDKRL